MNFDSQSNKNLIFPPILLQENIINKEKENVMGTF